MFTLTQKKILKLLAINSRFSNKDIAKSVGVSPDTVEYQIKLLTEKMKVCSLSTIFNHRALGYQEYHFLIRCKDISNMPIDELKKLSFVTFINTCYGGYDIQIIVQVKSLDELNTCKDIIFSLFKNNIQDYFLVNSQRYYTYSNILPAFDVDISVPKNRKNKIYSLANTDYIRPNDKSINLDDLDKKIIYALIKNSRESYLSMAKLFGVSRETIRYRVERFIDNDFINAFFIKPNYSAVGYFTNFLFIRFGAVDEAKLSQYFRDNKNIFFASRMIGSYNCIFYVLSKSPNELASILREFRILFKDSILDLLLLHYEKNYKEVQFPENI